MKHRLDALDSFLGGQSVARFDSPSAFVENELKQIVPDMYDEVYRDLDAVEVIPIDTSIAEGAPAWAYDSMKKAGKAKFIGAGSTDIPRADISKTRFTFPLRPSGLAYGWTFDEIRTAQWAGMPLDRASADAARRGQAELEHEVLLNGDESLGIPGLLTNVSLPRLAVSNGSWIAGGATPDDIIADMNSVLNKVITQSNKVHRATMLLLPLNEFLHIEGLRVTDTPETVLSYMLRTKQGLSIRPLIEMEDKGVTGGAAMLAYQMDRRILKGCIPMPFTQHPAQTKDMEVLINTEQKHGGTVVFYPLAFAYGDGI